MILTETQTRVLDQLRRRITELTADRDAAIAAGDRPGAEAAIDEYYAAAAELRAIYRR